MCQHTSRPWVMRPDNSIETKAGETVASFVDNAQYRSLIAAAPAMYLELKEGLVLLEASHHDMVDMYGIDSLQAKTVWERIESTRNTIAQAEGE